jgi:hypothetical protein
MEGPEQSAAGEASRFRQQAAAARKRAAEAEPGSRKEGNWLDIADSYEDLTDLAEKADKKDGRPD